MALAVIAIVAAVAVPTVATGIRLYALNTAAQTVASAVRSARYTAVSRNRTVRVRFDCPATDQFRIVEKTGTATIDNATDRCSTTAYPYPSTTYVDGPVQLLPSGAEFYSVQDLQIGTAGRVVPLSGCPTCIEGTGSVTVVVTNGSETQAINVSSNGQVQIP